MYHYINVWRNQLFIYMWSILKKDLVLRSIPTTEQRPIFSIFSRSAPSSPDVSPQSSPRPPRANNDRLTLLTRLVRKGEKKGLFVEKMPASIYQVKCGELAQRLQRRKSLHHSICSVGNRGRTLSHLTSPFVFCADGERWKSEVHEEQRCLQQWLLQLHPLPGLRQCSMCFYCLGLCSRCNWNPCFQVKAINHTEGLYSTIVSDEFCVWFVLQTKLKHPDYQPMSKESLQLAVHFLFHTYLHTKKKLRYVYTCIHTRQ